MHGILLKNDAAEERWMRRATTREKWRCEINDERGRMRMG